jgi:predicted RNA binding protein YcfA (HicA-like mRNA interferase family)
VLKPLKHHELQRILRDHDVRFQVYVNRGKGSHYMLYHPAINGRAVSVPVPHHGGRDIPPGILRQIIRRFDLPRNIFG